MASYNLGEARGKIILETDFSSLKEGQKVLDNAKKSAEDSAQSQQQAWGKVGTAATVGGAAVVAGFAAAVGAASGFEFKMSAIQAVSGATASEMDLIRDAALRIGKDTSFSASEAALAMEELLKAGVSVDDVLNGTTDAVVALAAAGQIELPEAATIASNALNQFKLGAEDMVEVADLMAGAANASATGVSEIGMALSFVGPTANAAGVSIGDAAQMIALFANNGIDGARAGTALRALISNLASPTAQATEALKQLGLITEDGGNQFFDASGKMKSMEEVTTLLRDAMSGMTSEQLLANGEVLVGRENLSALAAIVNTTSAEYDALGDAINSTSAADVAATRLDNMQGSMEALMGSIETLAISVGQRLIPTITEMINNLTAAFDWFMSLDEGTQNAVVGVAAVTGGLLLLAGATIKTIQGVQSAVATIKALEIASKASAAATAAKAAIEKGAAIATTVWTEAQKAAQVAVWLMQPANAAAAAGMIAMKAAAIAGAAAQGIATAAQWAWNAALTANPIGLIIAAIAALVAGLIWFFTQTELGQAIWEGFMTFLQEAWTNVSAFLTTLWEGLVTVVSTVWNAIMTAINAVVTWFQTYVMPIIQFVIDAIIAYFQMYYTVISTIWNAVMTAIGAVVDWFMTYVYPAIEAFVNFLVALFEYLGKWVAFIWEAISTAIMTVVNAVVSFLTTVWTEFSNFWRDIWNAVSSFVSTIWNNVVSFLTGIITTIVNWIVAQWTAFYNRFQAILNMVSSIVSSIWNNIWSFISGIVSNIVNWITDQWNSLIATVKGIFDKVYNSIKDPLDKALEFIGGIKDKIIGFFTGAGDWLYNIGKDIIDGFLKGLQDMFGEVVNFFNDLTNMIPEEKGPPEKDRVLLTDNGKLIMRSLYNGLASEMGNVEELLNGMNTTIPATLQQDIAANVQGNQRPSVVLNLEYHAAAGDGTKTKEDVMAMLGHATELVREEMS
ncbi:tape measure protein [Microbacterium phage Rachella]|uniref:Tape measure protein n=2 Tax=Krampusvirus krampus TaxID=2734242 RepID=A0A2Z4Q3M0_9CAUD|nr:tape measure protein [Microbacterium phage AnnaSerena]QCQ57391.1 tape measure protein [Microbacterium phage Rachella]